MTFLNIVGFGRRRQRSAPGGKWSRRCGHSHLALHRSPLTEGELYGGADAAGGAGDADCPNGKIAICGASACLEHGHRQNSEGK